MTCPTCGSTSHEVVRKPVILPGATLREHRCRACGERFASVQTVVTGAVASAIAEAVATATKRTTSSSKRLNVKALSAKGV